MYVSQSEFQRINEVEVEIEDEDDRRARCPDLRQPGYPCPEVKNAPLKHSNVKTALQSILLLMVENRCTLFLILPSHSLYAAGTSCTHSSSTRPDGTTRWTVKLRIPKTVFHAVFDLYLFGSLR